MSASKSRNKNCKHCLLLTTAFVNISKTASLSPNDQHQQQSQLIDDGHNNINNPSLELRLSGRRKLSGDDCEWTGSGRYSDDFGGADGPFPECVEPDMGFDEADMGFKSSSSGFACKVDDQGNIQVMRHHFSEKNCKGDVAGSTSEKYAFIETSLKCVGTGTNCPVAKSVSAKVEAPNAEDVSQSVKAEDEQGNEGSLNWSHSTIIMAISALILLCALFASFL